MHSLCVQSARGKRVADSVEALLGATFLASGGGLALGCKGTATPAPKEPRTGAAAAQVQACMQPACARPLQCTWDAAHLTRALAGTALLSERMTIMPPYSSLEIKRQLMGAPRPVSDIQHPASHVRMHAPQSKVHVRACACLRCLCGKVRMRTCVGACMCASASSRNDSTLLHVLLSGVYGVCFHMQISKLRSRFCSQCSHTHTHTLTHTHTCTRTHAHAHAHAHMHARTHARTHTQTHTHAHAHAHAHAHMHARTHTHRCTHARTHARTYKDTHTYTHT